MTFTHRPKLALPGHELAVHALHVSHRVNAPASAKVSVTLPEAADADSLRAWFGAEATLRYDDEEATVETWQIAALEADGRQLTVGLYGALARLQTAHGAIVQTHASLLDCACALLDRHGIAAEVAVSAEAATSPVAFLMQPDIDDLTFLAALADAGGFCVVDTLDDSGVALIDTASVGAATLTPLAGTSSRRRLRLAPGAGRPVAAGIATERNVAPLSVGATDAVAPSVRSGVSLDPDALRLQLDARADRASAHLSVEVETRNTAARPGWQASVDAAWADGPMSLYALSRHLDENQRVRSHIHLTDPADFTATGPEMPVLAPPAPRCARVVDVEHAGAKGFVTVALGQPEARLSVPAQLTAQSSGAGSGASILPRPDAWVAVLFIGDPLMPRPVVIGTLRDALDPPPQHDGTDPATLVLARSEAGSEVALSRGEGGDSLQIRIGETSTLTLGADGEVTLAGDAITIDAGTLTLKGNSIAMEQT